jgi:hypothetical protein
MDLNSVSRQFNLKVAKDLWVYLIATWELNIIHLPHIYSPFPI